MPPGDIYQAACFLRAERLTSRSLHRCHLYCGIRVRSTLLSLQPVSRLSLLGPFYKFLGVEFQQLRGFLAVAKTASMTEAAQQLHLTPSSVSIQIKKLEQELGVQL